MNSSRTIVLVAREDQQNLGIGYLSSILISRGFHTKMVDFSLSDERIYELLRELDPLLVGFSLIFQYHTDRLQNLASYLKRKGIKCHFTVGGHYPSLRYQDILGTIPELDSVVRFEGEFTICELAEQLFLGRDWTGIIGIAYRMNLKPISNELRPLITDLDILPFPVRNFDKKYICMSQNCSFIVASRGCVRNCSFCSVRRFYSTPSGKLRRSRNPLKVVIEMSNLYQKHNTKIFLFQDDDFFHPGKIGHNWVLNFIQELNNKRLADSILLKINCRPDEVEKDIFCSLKGVGLGLVYLGIESGNKTGLRMLNKQLGIEESIKAVKILNELDIFYEFGFMLFDPSSTFQSIRENIRFLRKICGDGSSLAVFGKMIPYAETDIEKQLLKENRLKGTVMRPDYDFLDSRLDGLYKFLYQIFHSTMLESTGLLARLRWHRFEFVVLKKFYSLAIGISDYAYSLKSTMKSFNALFFRTVESATNLFEKQKSTHSQELLELVKFYHKELKQIEKKRFERMLHFQKLNRLRRIYH